MDSKKPKSKSNAPLIVFGVVICCLIYLISTKQSIKIRNRLEDYEWDKAVNGILYINLDSRPDRKKKIDMQLEKAEVPMGLIHKIDGVLNNDCGHIGCAYSHVRALKYAKNKNWDRVLILEDDFEFKQPNNMLFNTLKQLPKKFDVFMLATTYNENMSIGHPTVHKVKYATTTSGYIVQQHYYNTLISCFEDAISKMEAELIEFKKTNPNKKMYETKYAIDQHWFLLQQRDDFFITVPNIGTQGNSPSTIMS